MGRFFARTADQLEHYVRQLAWLNTAPEIEHKGDGPKPESKARIVTLRDKDEPVPLPDNPAPHITDWLLEIGPTSATAGGEGPVSWEALAGWQSITGIELDPWEARTIRRLSDAFASQRSQSRKPDTPSPMDSAAKVTADTQARADAQFKAMMVAFSKPPNRKG